MNQPIDYQAFSSLVRRLAEAWATQDTETAVQCFTPDAVYMQPPDIQLYTGHDQCMHL